VRAKGQQDTRQEPLLQGITTQYCDMGSNRQQQGQHGCQGIINQHQRLKQEWYNVVV
jgi:hypothetical protein